MTGRKEENKREDGGRRQAGHRGRISEIRGEKRQKKPESAAPTDRNVDLSGILLPLFSPPCSICNPLEQRSRFQASSCQTTGML